MANKLEAKDGYVFAKADKSAVYGALMYLGVHDKPENYIQITTEEAQALEAELRAKAEAEIQENEA